MAAEEEIGERKLKKVSRLEARKQELLNITKRFVEEIDRVCLDGRVQSITHLEADLMLYKAAISEMERGKYTVDVLSLHRAKKHYNIDQDYVLHGFKNPELSGPMRHGRRLNIFEPFNRKERTGRKYNKIKKQA